MSRLEEALERDTTAKVVAERLRNDIQDGSLAPGTRLRQNDLAERFGVSTTPVREALAQLQAEGLVRIDPHRGAVVFHPTVEDLIEYYEIREVLESLAITHAIPNLTSDDARSLNEIIERMRRTDNPRRWLKLNDEFHLRLYARAQRPYLSSMIGNLRDASTPYIYMFIASQAPSDSTNEEHQAILDACVRGDATSAKKAISRHLRHAVRELTRSVNVIGGLADARDR